MYIRNIQIQNIKALHQVTWDIELERAPGWHVILGDNGAGKSTFLRAVALALLGPSEIKGLRLDEVSYLTQGQGKASIVLSIHAERGVDLAEGVEAPSIKPIQAKLQLQPEAGFSASDQKSPKPERHVWGKGGGWFSAGFGAFRRFTRGNRAYDRLFVEQPKMAAHLSLFGEDVALTETVRWLQDLDYQDLKLRAQGEAGSPLLADIKSFLKQPELLPHDTKLADISAQRVSFTDGRGATVDLKSLSDGFRSILSLTMELIRQMERCYGSKDLFVHHEDGRLTINRAGVVLIDEVDAHLHPTWQRRVGPWFRRFFPKVQFIVATHSPWVCQAAEEGSVFWLPAPDSDQEARFLRGVELERILYGNILEAYGTHVFGAVDRSQRAKEMLDRLARLNLKSLEEDLATEEEQEQAHLSSIFATEIPRRSRQEQAQRIALLKERMRGGGS